MKTLIESGRAVGALLALALAGCTTPVPVVSEAIRCEPASEIARRCDLPLAVREGITYGELVQLMQSDRQALGSCADRHEALAKAIAVCNEQIDSHNQRLRGMNAANAARP